MKHLLHALDGLAKEFANDPQAQADVARLRQLAEAAGVRAGEAAEKELAGSAAEAVAQLEAHFAGNAHALQRVDRLKALLPKPEPTPAPKPVDVAPADAPPPGPVTN